MTPLMIAPTAGPAMTGPAADTASTESDSESGESFASVLAEVPSGSGTAASGQPSKAGQGKSGPDQTGPGSADPSTAAAVLMLAGAALPLRPLLPVATPADAQPTGTAALDTVASGPVSAAAAGNSAPAAAAATPTAPAAPPAVAQSGPTGQPSADQPTTGQPTTGQPAADVQAAGQLPIAGRPGTQPAGLAGQATSTAVVAKAANGQQPTDTPSDTAQSSTSAPSTTATAPPAGLAASAALQAAAQATVASQPPVAGTVTGKAAQPALAGIGQPVRAATPARQPGTDTGAGSQHGDNGSYGGPARTVSSRDASTVRTEFAPVATVPSPVQPTAPASQPVAGQPIVAHQPSIEPVSAPPATLPNVPSHDYPAVAQPMTHQLAGPVLGLRAGGDASHQLSIALHPADLGAVSVHVRITGDAMTIQLASASESAHAAIQDALPQLRQELQSAGLSSVEVSLDLAAGNSGGQADPRQADRSPGHSGAAPPPIESPARPSPQVRSAGPGTTGLDRWL